MRTKLLAATAFVALTLAGCATPARDVAPAAPAPAAAPAGLNIPMQYYTLPNGLKVVLSRDTTVPTATVMIYYGIGFRVEPRNRTGFAHLFEHLLFQGSANAPKGTFIGTVTESGGVLNGSTRFDHTNYYEVVPSNALETMLWLEADRMARPVINQEVLENQQGVVTNEVKVNVLNTPYGGFPWLDMPQLANENWHNAHNFYGALEDLQAATVKDAKDFFDNYYRPNNAVLVVAGDIDYDQTRAMIQRYFGPIPRGAPVTLPDVSEPRQTVEKYREKTDPLAPRPAYAAAYHIPPRNTPEWYAMGLLDEILVQGPDSRLYQELVQRRGITSNVTGGINYLGNMYNIKGPMHWMFNFIHDPSHSREQVTAAIDSVIEDVRARGVTQAELDRARTQIRSDLYNLLDTGDRFELTDLLGAYAMFDDNPAGVNQIEAGFASVTPELVQRVAQEYLRPTNRSVFVVKPGAAAAQGAGQ